MLRKVYLGLSWVLFRLLAQAKSGLAKGEPTMKQYAVTIARGFGSGGRTIGLMLSEKLSIPCFDQDLIKLASEESGISVELFDRADEKVRPGLFKRGKKADLYRLVTPDSSEFVSDDNLFNYQAKIIRDLAASESCIIIGRCADEILRGRSQVIKVFVYADREFCIEKVMSLYALSKKEAIQKIETVDKNRQAYYKYYTGKEWDNVRNYDLCLNSGELGFAKCVDMIESYLQIKNT